MEQVFGLKIHLKLFVKVQSDWTERQDNLRLMGLAQ
jgi:GTPase Era involved in 16S rRNA processing